MALNQQVKQYYFENINLLPQDKQFHYATRLAAWEGDDRAFELLKELKSYIVPDASKDALQAQFAEMIAKPQSGKRNAHDLRKPFFEKYPQLYGIHSALFRARHLEAVYGINPREAFFACADQTQMDKLAESLLADDDAVRVLSTFAVNFFYLYQGVVLGQKDRIDPQHFIDISRQYDLKDPLQLQLLIYLFTHCIIGESNFYTEKIAESRLLPYTKMLQTLEPVIAANFKDINLDNKLEFLVCCRICGVDSTLFSKVYDECQESISPQGQFLIDRHNTNPQFSKASFESSEHRNVLFIMSSSPYVPHFTLVQ